MNWFFEGNPTFTILVLSLMTHNDANCLHDDVQTHMCALYCGALDNLLQYRHAIRAAECEGFQKINLHEGGYHACHILHVRPLTLAC